MNNRRSTKAGEGKPYLEAEVFAGLQSLAKAELSALFGKRLKFKTSRQSDQISFRLKGRWDRLNELRLATAVYRVIPFAIPRPKALLGHQYWQRLLEAIDEIRSHYRPATFRTFRISAAGSDSKLFQRIKQQLEQDANLQLDENEADLFLRIRRAEAGWEVLIRLTPRPLSARSWRVANMPGALNATVAAAMAKIAQPVPSDEVLNLMCGSGTLLVELLLLQPVRTAVGIDLSQSALAAAQKNLAAASIRAAALAQSDAAALPFSSSSFSLLTADLPWGQLVGSHAENEILYPQILKEAARVAQPKGRFVLITHEVRLLEQALSQQHEWRLADMWKLVQGKLRPRLYLLQKASNL